MMKLTDLVAPEQYNLTQEIEQHYSDKIALKWHDDEGNHEEVTYRQLIDRANKLANGLKALGLKKGDRMMVIVPRLVQSYVIYLAAFKSGLVIIPGSQMLRAKDIAYRLNQSEAKAVISYYDYCEEVDLIKEPTPSLQHKLTFGEDVVGWDRLEPLVDQHSATFEAPITHKDDMALLSYTSGTTGNPKGVVHSHGWAYAHLRIAPTKWLNIKENDTVWATAGPGWQKWIWSPFLSVLGTGSTGFVYNGRFDAKQYMQLLQDHQINVLCCTPTEYRLIAKLDDLGSFDLSHLRSAVSAGEPLNREMIDVFQRNFNIQVRDGYGQTENTLLIGTLDGTTMRPGSMGKPIIDTFIDIIDEDGQPVKAGEVGDIAVRKDFPALFKTYYKEPERTQSALRGNYYLTGDKASKDADGYYWFEGRGDDIIISSGYTIGPFEVEDALIKHAAVRECAVVASPDPIRGHVVKAFVVLRDDVKESDELVKELQDHVKAVTAPYKYPRKVSFVEALPKTESGKIRRIELRKQEEQLTQA